jgi:hypothetical protein
MQNHANPSSDLTPRSAQAKPPPAAKFFLVRCKGFRCLAYKDPEGEWRNPRDGSPLPEVLAVLSDP